MSVFPGFVGWINQNIQQPLKGESKRSENGESNSVSEKDTNKREFYYDKPEAIKQGKLWRAAEKKKPWYDAPAKVKVTTKKGLCHMHIELTVGLPPEGVYDLFANPNDFPFFRIDNETGRELLASIFPGFGRFINQNTQQPPMAESKKSGNVKPKSVSETYPEDREELKKQLKLWRASDKKSPWYDYSPKVKVTKEKDLCHLNMQFTIGLPPEAVFDILTTYENPSYFTMMKKRQTLEHRSSKVFSDLGPTEKHVNVEKAAPWRFLWWSGTIPVHLTFNESRKDFSALYMIPKKNVMFMKTFFGKWQVEPWYVDNSRYCKPRLPKNREEYRQCSGGKGLIASRVTIVQSFKPSSYLNIPPLSWYIRRVTIKTTKALVEDLQIRAAVIRSV